MPNSAMPAMSRLVAIGRRMKISERFISETGMAKWLMAISHQPSAMSLSLPLTAPAPSAAAAAGGAAARQIRGDPRAGFEAQLAFGDDGFTGRQSLLHDDVVSDALAGHDG